MNEGKQRDEKGPAQVVWGFLAALAGRLFAEAISGWWKRHDL